MLYRKFDMQRNVKNEKLNENCEEKDFLNEKLKLKFSRTQTLF